MTEDHEPDEDLDAAPAPLEAVSDDPEAAEDEEAAEQDQAASEPQEAAQSSPQTEKELRKLTDKLAAEAKRHAKRVEEIMGEDSLALIQCPLCEPDIPGWCWPLEMTPPRDELHARLLQVLAVPTGPVLRSDPENAECQSCGGEGSLLTRSKVPQYRTKVCGTCGGAGFVGPGNPFTHPGTFTPEPKLPTEENGTPDYAAAFKAAQAQLGVAQVTALP